MDTGANFIRAVLQIERNVSGPLERPWVDPKSYKHCIEFRLHLQTTRSVLGLD